MHRGRIHHRLTMKDVRPEAVIVPLSTGSLPLGASDLGGGVISRMNGVVVGNAGGEPGMSGAPGGVGVAPHVVVLSCALTLASRVV